MPPIRQLLPARAACGLGLPSNPAVSLPAGRVRSVQRRLRVCEWVPPAHPRQVRNDGRVCGRRDGLRGLIAGRNGLPRDEPREMLEWRVCRGCGGVPRSVGVCGKYPSG